LGDTVAALPCFHLIERAFPDAERLVLTNVPVSTKAAPLEIILKDGGFIHGAIPYPIGLRNPAELVRLAGKLRRQRASALIYLAAGRGLRAVRRDVAYFRMCGFRRVIGAPLTPDLHDNRVDANGTLERESHRLGRTMAELGAIDFADRAWWDLRLTGPERRTGASALDALAGAPFVAVNTGGKAIEKDWGEDNWARLLGALATSFEGHGLAFVGAREDRERASRLGPSWPAGPVIDLCGTLTPRQSAAALSHARAFIGHDSGPLHLADAVGTPCIGLFGDYNRPDLWHPSGSTTTVIHRMEGLAAIKPSEIEAVVSQLLASVDSS
jgi:ADP-heptose:LPS heptosyltransferase